ncbi:MAG: cysteine--tRNA ligase [Trueperaceae bacterium]|nr:cysteine--tRNA ligase [Trueperaceae bacterium]
MALHLYDSKTRRKTPFEPVTPGHAGLYFCGPTVYSEPHLGHARGPVVFDVLRNWLEHEGYRVRLVSNVTDVGHLTDDADQGEDKLAARAKLERLEPMEIAEKYFWAYFDAMARLKVRRPSVVPRATGHIPEQIALVQNLLEAGLAYERDGNVYFDVSQWPDYGELSGRDPEELVEGTRVEVRSDKDDPHDFALWKAAGEEHIMQWASPWGQGFPGWHLECSVMSTKYLGETFDVHGGGLDLIFPHHECELAQSRGVGMPFARTWLHWNMMTMDGEKMSKSKGHFVALADLFDAFDPTVVRFHLLRSHYRSLSEFGDAAIVSSRQGLGRLRESHAWLRDRAGGAEPDGRFGAAAREAFTEAMNDDLNTPQAIAALFELVREANRRGDALTPEEAADAAAVIGSLLGDVLGVPPSAEAEEGAAARDRLEGLLELVLEQRKAARTRRDFGTADALRDRLAELGIEVEDTARGPRVKLS